MDSYPIGMCWSHATQGILAKCYMNASKKIHTSSSSCFASAPPLSGTTAVLALDVAGSNLNLKTINVRNAAAFMCMAKPIDTTTGSSG